MNVAAVSPVPSEPARSGVPRSLVVADVGGTFARLALAETLPGQAPRLGSYRTYACADHPSLAAILADFTASLGQPMASAVVAIAGLLDGDTLINANLPWTVSLSATRRESGLPDLQLINDFEAVALAIPYLQADTLVPLNGDADPATTFPALVLGPGTGLGAALRFADGERPVLASEIGHAALGAGNALELHVLGRLLQRWPHVDNERVLSGSGLMNLYPCLCELRGVAPQWT
ncbi:glucokinase, partial [Stenotrophomonas sp. HMWF022]